MRAVVFRRLLDRAALTRVEHYIADRPGLALEVCDAEHAAEPEVTAVLGRCGVVMHPSPDAGWVVAAGLAAGCGVWADLRHAAAHPDVAVSFADAAARGEHVINAQRVARV